MATRGGPWRGRLDPGRSSSVNPMINIVGNTVRRRCDAYPDTALRLELAADLKYNKRLFCAQRVGVPAAR
jgi:hypothetical protein